MNYKQGEKPFKESRAVCFSLIIIFIFSYISFLYSHPEPSDNIDIVLLIDSSGSMKTNDPGNLRLQAAKSFIDLANVGDKISIVDFSSKCKVHSRLAIIKDIVDRRKLKECIDLIGYSGAKTDILSALEEALLIMKAGAKENHQQAVILLTDGKLELPITNRFFHHPERGINEISYKYRESNIGIWSIAYTNKADVELLSRLSRISDGFLYIAKQDIELLKVYIDIFVDLKKKYRSFDFDTTVSFVRPIKRQLLVDKYVKDITFAVNRTDESIKIDVETPKGKIINSGNGENIFCAEAEKYKIIRIVNPPTGWWKLLIEGKGRVYGQVIETTDLRVDLGTSKLFYGLRELIKINANLALRDNLVKDARLLQNSIFKLNIERPDGGRDEIQLFDDGKSGDLKPGDGIYSNSYAGYPLEGEYSLHLEVYKKDVFVRKIAFRIYKGSVFELSTKEIDFGKVVEGEEANCYLVARSSYTGKQSFIPHILTFNPINTVEEPSVDFPSIEPQTIDFFPGKTSEVEIHLTTEDLPHGKYEGQLKLEPLLQSGKQMKTKGNAAPLNPALIKFSMEIVPRPLSLTILIPIIGVAFLICLLGVLVMFSKRQPNFFGTIIHESSSGDIKQYPLMAIKRGFFRRLSEKGREIKVGSVSSADIRLIGEGVEEKHAVLKAEKYDRGNVNIVIYPEQGCDVWLNKQALSGLSRTLKHDDIIKIGNQRLRFEHFAQATDDGLDIDNNYLREE